MGGGPGGELPGGSDAWLVRPHQKSAGGASSWQCFLCTVRQARNVLSSMLAAALPAMAGAACQGGEWLLQPSLCDGMTHGAGLAPRWQHPAHWSAAGVRGVVGRMLAGSVSVPAGGGSGVHRPASPAAGQQARAGLLLRSASVVPATLAAWPCRRLAAWWQHTPWCSYCQAMYMFRVRGYLLCTGSCCWLGVAPAG